MDKQSIDANLPKVIAYLSKQNKDASVTEITDLAMSICSDAPRKHTQSVSFGDTPETSAGKVKLFGETDTTLLPKEQLIEVEVVNDTAIEYPVDDGTVELFTFEKSTLNRLGPKLNGVPIVIGNGHDADLPVAVFTDKYDVREVTDDSGTRNALYAFAKVRTDIDAPVNAEKLFKDPAFVINGGTKNLAGSLKFSSKDVPYFYEDGTKINYMTHPAPRHYALLDSPYILESGVKNKNFGNTEVDIMSEENKTTETVEAPVAEAPVTPAEEVVAPEAKTETVEAVEAPAVEAPLVEAVAEEAEVPETVLKAEYDEVMARLATIETELEDARRASVIAEITAKKHGVEATEEQREAVVQEMKAFGELELRGYLAGLGGKTVDGVKNFGKGRVTADAPASTGIKLNLPYLNKRKQG